MIREYHQRDWSEVCRVFDRSKPHELAAGGIGESFVPLADDEKRIADFARSTVFVWEEKGKLRGFVGHEGSYIGWLFVDPAAFRSGIARALLRHILPRLNGEPWLWAMKNNRAAISLYRSEGFEIVEERETQNGGMPCLAVKLQLRKKAPKQQSPEPTPQAVMHPRDAGCAPPADMTHR
ncbi:MAG: GNAT family N-acetyltransferase [Opitutaceae bacterium]|jgi:ribosomal protein S18 acetylase RimI-like enzyme